MIVLRVRLDQRKSGLSTQLALISAHILNLFNSENLPADYLLCFFEQQ